MNILHYSLGFPPFRRGGMTQYCLDLMIEQAKVGHQVGLLWPGRLYDLTPKSKVNQKKDAARVRDSISIYEQWFSLFKKINDTELQRYLYGVLIKYYISNCKVRGIKGFVINGLDFSFCFRNALNSREKFKVLFFGILPGVYCTYVR